MRVKMLSVAGLMAALQALNVTEIILAGEAAMPAPSS